jgi:hypothetical protein
MNFGQRFSELTAQRNAQRIKHGEAKRGKMSAEYRAWLAMFTRCHNPNGSRWQYYGGRGIMMCDRWHHFENFLADMGRRPTSQHSLDRINNDGNYEPSNCQWATKAEQANNRRPRKRKFDRSDRKAVNAYNRERYHRLHPEARWKS